MACISVCGTTEESAVDRLDLVEEVRSQAWHELGVAFHLHADACYGGYAASLIRVPTESSAAPRDSRLGTEAPPDADGRQWPSEGSCGRLRPSSTPTR
jgi:hypothetical protein